MTKHDENMGTHALQSQIQFDMRSAEWGVQIGGVKRQVKKLGSTLEVVFLVDFTDLLFLSILI